MSNANTKRLFVPQNGQLKPITKPWPPFSNEILREWFICPPAWGCRLLEIHLSSKARTFIQTVKTTFGIPATYLPDGCSYEDYFWPVDGQSVILYDYGNQLQEILQKMAVFLIYTYFAETVIIHSGSHELQIIHFKYKR